MAINERTYDPRAAAVELRAQLASEKRRLGFLIGAGTSMAAGLPGIDELTDLVEKALPGEFGEHFRRQRTNLGGKANVEAVLDRVRLVRELMGNDETKEIDGLTGPAASALDCRICRAIASEVQTERAKGIEPQMAFARWLRMLHAMRDFPVEVFTTNYDVLLETAMDRIGLPYFDGFVGAIEPFFAAESVEWDGGALGHAARPPQAWTRLWKLHGSIRWRLKLEDGGNFRRIVRGDASDLLADEELVIFPSREKYAQSRKLPFVAFQDRLRQFLRSGEVLFVIVGYRFSDEHINEVIFEALRGANSRLAVTALMYEDIPPHVTAESRGSLNFTVYGPKDAVISRAEGAWSEPVERIAPDKLVSPWNSASKHFTLGEFATFASFLESHVAFSRSPVASAGERVTSTDDSATSTPGSGE